MELNNRHKILLSAYACEPNKGSEPGVGWNWVIHLAEKYEVYVITRKNNQEPIEQFVRDNRLEHVQFYYHDCSKLWRKIKKFPNGIFLYYKKWQQEILPLARTIVKKENIELVHHVTFNEFRTPGKLYKLDVPFVWGPVGGGQFYRKEYREVYFRKKDIVKELVRNGINRYCLWGSKDIKNVIETASIILIADQSTESIMSKKRSYVRLLETAYNTERNGIKKYNKDADKPIKLLWVGGIWPRKGLKLLIDALGKTEFKDFELNIVGDGEDKKKCQLLVESYGMEDKIHFLGKMSYQQVNEQYEKADVFIFTSLRDTSGNVILEAMSHGLPVITLDHHGAGEIVTNQTGIKICYDSYDSVLKRLIAAIEKYKKEPKLMEIHGMAARKRIEEVYSWKYNMDKMCEVYSKVLNAVPKEGKI